MALAVNVINESGPSNKYVLPIIAKKTKVMQY